LNDVRVVDAHRRPIDPAALSARTVAVDATQRARIVRLARAGGLVVESRAESRHGVGTAALLVVQGGFAEPSSAREVAAQLAAMRTDGALAPVAFASIAFRAAGPAELVVPSVTLFTRGGEDEALLVSADGGAQLDEVLDANEPPGEPEPAPHTFTVMCPEARDDYLRRVRDATDAIAIGAFDKVVLARNCVVTADAPYRRGALVEAIRAAQPKTTVFAVDGFLGASPELLIERRGVHVASTPLAGTVPHLADARDNAATIATLVGSKKERFEHLVVVEEIEKVLTACGASLEVAPQPEPLELATVTHLATSITGTLEGDADSGRMGALELALALHPTPAIGGSPRQAALAYLARTEPFERGRYGGPVGYVDANGDGAWWIGIRSATLDRHRALLCAGGGIVAGSDPEAEFAETEAKFASLLPILTSA
jgi:menaquinone-specific isochorismate synthase